MSSYVDKLDVCYRFMKTDHLRKNLRTVSRTHGSTGADRLQRCATRGVAKRESGTFVGTACRRRGDLYVIS